MPAHVITLNSYYYAAIVAAWWSRVWNDETVYLNHKDFRRYQDVRLCEVTQLPTSHSFLVGTKDLTFGSFKHHGKNIVQVKALDIPGEIYLDMCEYGYDNVVKTVQRKVIHDFQFPDNPDIPYSHQNLVPMFYVNEKGLMLVYGNSFAYLPLDGRNLPQGRYDPVNPFVSLPFARDTKLKFNSLTPRAIFCDGTRRVRLCYEDGYQEEQWFFVVLPGASVFQSDFANIITRAEPQEVDIHSPRIRMHRFKMFRWPDTYLHDYVILNNMRRINGQPEVPAPEYVHPAFKILNH